MTGTLCEDCPPVGYPTDETRCMPCPRRFDANPARVDPRDPDHSRQGIFVYHNCAYCSDGKKPCKQGAPNRCSNPHARND